MERKDDIEAKGAQLIAIGNGQPHWAQAFIVDEDIDFPVYVDPSRQSYEAYQMRRGATEVFSLRSLRNAARATREGFRQTETRGDPVQNGGVVVVGESREILYLHVEREAGDLADLDEVIAALD